jgi:heme exporter protein A
VTDALIRLRGLTKVYDLLPVLKKIDLDIARGECVALLGANGSGKSTLLRLLAGLGKPTAGTIHIGGWELPREAAAVRAQIGMVSHKPLLYENLTARENLAFFARLYHTPPPPLRVQRGGVGSASDRASTEPSPDSDSPSPHAERGAGGEVSHLLTRVGLSKRADDRARTFSRGMQQRLSIARALLHQPDILLLDEPYTGLDQDGAAMLDTLVHEQRAAGRTIVISTHELERAARLCSRVVILARGGVAYDAPTAGMTTAALADVYAGVGSR